LYLRLIDVVYHSTVGLRVIKKKKKYQLSRVRVERVGRPQLLACPVPACPRPSIIYADTKRPSIIYADTKRCVVEKFP